MPKITEMYAFVMEDSGPDDEGVMAMQLGDFWYPLVGADMDRVNVLKPHADDLARREGKPYKILKFSRREDITDGHTE
jgi:hypothetical protein